MHRNAREGFLFEARNGPTTSPTSFETTVGACTISMLPDSSFEKSSTWSTSRTSDLPLARIESTACSRSASFLKPVFIISENPMMALRGVRMSWLTVEKK